MGNCYGIDNNKCDNQNNSKYYCSECNGRGEIIIQNENYSCFQSPVTFLTCQKCQGTGCCNPNYCEHCYGTGCKTDRF